MKMLTPLTSTVRNTIRSTAIATIALGTLTLPTLASAGEYHRNANRNNECRAQEDEAQVIGAVLGAVLGGVIGSEVSGNGARTEGAAVGAVLGGLAGAGIGDESVNCDKKRRNRNYKNGYTRVGYNDGYYNTTQPRRHNGYNNGYGYDNRYKSYPSNYGQSRQDRQRLDRIERRLDTVRYQIKDLRQEQNYLKRVAKHEGYSYRLDRRRQEVYAELQRLRNKKQRLKNKRRLILNS